MKGISVLLLAAVALLVVGCNTTQTNNLADPFVGGTNGLAISFEQQAPPAEIYDGGQYPFSVIVKIENLGEADVGPASVEGATGDNTFALVELIGFNPAQFADPSQGGLVVAKTFADENIDVYGVRRNFDGTIVAGTPNVMQFSGFNYMPDEQGNSGVQIRANICYDYTTRSSTRVCIKDNLLENIQDSSICTLTGAKDVKNSGAPVHVTMLQQNPLGRDRIQVTFTIENVGTGRVFHKVGSGYIGSALQGNGPCDSSLTNPDRDVVFVDVALNDGASTGGIQCPLLGNSNSGFIKMFAGNAVTLSCTIPTNPSGSRIYTDTLRVNLQYAYSQFVETPILIRDVTVGPVSGN